MLTLFAILYSVPVSAQPSNEATPPVESATHQQLHSVIEANEARLTVVNFWATWCIPCREEFPYFVQLGRDFEDQGVDVLFVSMDFEDQLDATRAFLQEQGVTATSYLKQGKDEPFINAFHESWSGGIPATFVYGQAGQLVDFWEGKVTQQELKQRVTEALRHARERK